MGHRSSSNLFRLGRQRSWHSQWFAKSEYTYLVSLDYRIRDFIDYIFYNLRWPSSELRIKRFISRNVFLEIMLVIPNERIIQYLDSIHFFKMRASTARLDPYRFNTLALDFNYVVWNMSYSILNRSVFYLLLSALKRVSQYNKVLATSIYTKLFNIVPFNLRRRLYRKNRFFYRRISSSNPLDRFFVRTVLSRINTEGAHGLKHSPRKVALSYKRRRYSNSQSSISSIAYRHNKHSSIKRVGTTKPYIGRVNNKPSHSLSFIKKVSSEKKSFFGDDFFPVVPSIGERSINARSYGIRRFSGVQSDTLQPIINVHTDYHFQKRFLVNNRKHCNLHSSMHFSGSKFWRGNQFHRKNAMRDRSIVLNKYNRNKVLASKSKRYRKFRYLITNLVSLLMISNDVVKIGSVKKYLYFLKYMRLLHERFKRRLNRSQGRFFKGAGKFISKDFAVNMLRHYAYNKGSMLAKYYRHYVTGSYYPLTYSNKSLKRYNRVFSKRDSFNWHFLKKHEILNYYNDYMLKLYLFSDSLLDRNFNFKNRIFNNIRKRSIFAWLIHSLHACTQYSPCIIRRSKFVRIIFQLLYNTATLTTKKKYSALSRLCNKLKLKKKLLKLGYAIRGINTIEALTCLEKYRPIYRPLKFFFNSGKMWYFYSSVHWWYKILFFVKDRKIANHNSFSILYNNFYYSVVSRKFTNYFNFFRFENLVHAPVKFLRYYKKFILCETRHFSFFRSTKKTMLFILYMHIYFVKRFAYIQLFLNNLVSCTTSISYGHLDIAVNQQHICTFLFLYHFINHLKFISIAIRVLQLNNIFTICDQVVFFFCKVFSILHFINPKKYPSDIRHYFSCFSKYIHTVIKPYNRGNFKKFPVRLRDKSQDRDKGLKRIRLLNAEFLIDKKEDVLVGCPDFEDLSTIVYKLSTLHISLLNIFCVNSLDKINNSSFNFSDNVSFLQFFKALPGLIKYPYFLLKRGNNIRSAHKNFAFKKNYFKCIPKYIASIQMNNLLSKKHVFFFRFIVDKLLFRLDTLRKDVLPVQALRSLSLMIEYNLSCYLSNRVLFLPIYYLGKKLPMKQARIVCLYISYELEKGMPYFLIVKQLGFVSNYRRRYVKKRYFKGFNNIFYYGVSKLDRRLLRSFSYEFTKYRLNSQSKSVMKYFLFRTFYSISLFRGFTRRIGIRIACSGRVHRRNTRSHTMWFVRGSMPLRIFDKYIDYYSSHAVTHLGTVGIKTWIYLTQFSSLGR